MTPYEQRFINDMILVAFKLTAWGFLLGSICFGAVATVDAIGDLYWRRRPWKNVSIVLASIAVFYAMALFIDQGA